MNQADPIRLYMSMSLDGFIAGADDRRGQEMGGAASGCSTGWTTGSATGRTARCTAKDSRPVP